MKKVTVLFVSILVFVFLISPVHAASPRTSTSYKINSGSGGVDFYPYLSHDKRVLTVDFQSPHLESIEYVNYNLNYNTADDGNLRGAEGTIYPVKKDFKYYNKIPYIRRDIVLGSCSKNVCVYNANPNHFKITVNTKFKNKNAVYTKVYNIY